MEMASSEVEMSSCQTLNCVLSPHERCTRGDHNNNKKNNNNNVRNINVAFEKNLNVFVRDQLDNRSISGDDGGDSTKKVPESSSDKSSVSDQRLSKTEESRHEVLSSSSSIGSDPDPNSSNSGQPGNQSRNETRAASSLVQIWEARTTQQPPSSNPNQSQIDSRTSSSGSNTLLENSVSLNEESIKESDLIHQPIEEGNNEEEEEEVECDSQFVCPLLPLDSGDKERESVRVVDIIRKLSSDSETTTNNDNNENGKEVQTTEVRCIPQVTCTPRIRGRQAFTDLLDQMIRDRNEELARILRSHSVSKFTHRGRIQSVLRIRCYERCIAIQDSHRCKSSSSTVSNLNRSPRGSGVMHLLREKPKPNSETIETGALSSTASSRGLVLDKDPNKAAEKTMEKSDLKERGENQETKEKAIAKESLGGRKKKPIEKSVDWDNVMGIAEKVNLWSSEGKLNRRKETEKDKMKGKAKTDRVEKNDVLEEASKRISSVESAESSITASKETMTQCHLGENIVIRKKQEECVSVETKSKEIENTNSNPQVTAQAEEKVLQETSAKSDLKKPTENGSREERRETEESVEGNTMMGIAEKVNLWNAQEKKNRRSFMGKRTGRANTEKNKVLQEASRRLKNVETAERSITTSKETVEKVVGTQNMEDKRESSIETTRCEFGEEGTGKEEKDIASVEDKSKKSVEDKKKNPQESAGEGSREKAKEENSSQQDEQMSILRDSKDENIIKESEDEETNKVESEEKGENVREAAMDSENDWDENELEEEYDDESDYDIDIIDTDWINEIARPRSYWEDLRKERYLEVFNTNSEKKDDICDLIKSGTVSSFLTSDLRERIDNLIVTRVQRHLKVQVNQEEEAREDDKYDEEREDEDECSARIQEDNETEDELEETTLEAESDGCSQSSPRSCTMMMSLSFRDQDIVNDQEPAMPLSLTEPSVPTNQSTPEMQMINELRGQMEQIQREVLELRNTVKSSIDMQLNFQKSITQDLRRFGGSSSEEGVETRSDPLKRKCCVCSEMPIDSLLYRCGHMCTCLKCAHELQWNSKKCPICMAPIVDVVRAFLES